MGIQLSDLQKLRQEPSGAGRAQIAQKVASEFSEGKFGASEKQVAIEIFRLLVSDTEVQVRKMLSKQLAHSLEAPHDVILKLAQDITEVALPVLENSYVLSEDDLIAITRSTKDAAVMTSIAKRDTVSRELSQALLQKSNISVIETLLKNKSASIDDDGLNQIYATCSDDTPSVLELMVKRGGLPVTLAEKLFVAVSDEMKKVLTHHYKLSLQVADSTTKDIRELATLGLVDGDMRTMDITKLINQLYQQGRLTLSIIIRSLCLGDMRFFEQAMAKLADVPVVNARLLVLDQGDSGFEALYRTSCLPMELYPATYYLLKIALEETSYGRFQCNDFRHRLASRLSQDDAAQEIEYMDYLVTLIRNTVYDTPAA